jgi:hypothetical protein
MARYFFNLRHRTGPVGLAVDPEGEELPDLRLRLHWRGGRPSPTAEDDTGRDRRPARLRRF